MNLIDKQQLIDDLLILALDRNNLSIKDIYELIRKQKTIVSTVPCAIKKGGINEDKEEADQKADT